MKFSAERPAHGDAVEGRIVNRVFKGARTAVDVRIGGADASIIKAYVDAGDVERIAGEQIWVSWAPGHLLVLSD